MVRPPEPDRVDLDQAAEQEENGGDGQCERDRARRIGGECRHADDALLRMARAHPELRVVAADDQQQMQGEQNRNQDREQEDVRDVHPSLERRDPREGPAPDQHREARPDDRDRHHDPVCDRKPHPREQVVHERVAEEPLEQRQHQHPDPGVVDELTRLAERAREEDAHHVQDDCDDEHVGRPVVRLAHEQPGLDLERDVDDRAVRLGHLLALERPI